MPERFLHDHPDFKSLLEITSREEEILEPSLVEKDYWIMHVLWGLSAQGLKYEPKGGTSLSKGFGLIHRFSEDIDKLIHPPAGVSVAHGKNKNKPPHIKSRRDYFDSLTKQIRIPGISQVTRDPEFDDPDKHRNAGIRLSYESHFDSVEGLKDGILLEVGFDRTQPSTKRLVSSWAYDRGVSSAGSILDNRAVDVACYRPEYTFVEKIQTVIRKSRQFREDGTLQRNFLRHYYDIYMLLGSEDVRSFIGTNEYMKHKTERIRGKDLEFGIQAAFDILRPELEREYARTAELYYRGQPSLSEIADRIAPYLNKL